MSRVAVVVALLAIAGCPEKTQPPPPELKADKAAPPPSVAGLDVVPADAVAVVGIDFAQLRESKVASQFVGALLSLDREVRTRVFALGKACNVNVGADIDSATIGIGPADKQVLASFSGRVDATTLWKCLQERGAVSEEVELSGRKFVSARGLEGELWLSRGRDDTIVASTDQKWLERALGRDLKVSENDAMIELLARTDRNAPAWFAGRLDPELGAGLVEMTDGDVSAPPRALFGALTVRRAKGREIAVLRLSIVFESPSDAKVARQFARAQLEALTLVAQGQGLGPVVGNVAARAKDETLVLVLRLRAEEVELLANTLNEMKNAPRLKRRRRSGKRTQH